MYKKLIALIIVLGIGLRLKEYLLVRTFSFDEAAVAISLMDKPWSQIGNLDYHMHRPLGFLVIIKSLITLFGTGELVFRLLALVSGIVSVVMFYKLARKLLTANLTGLALLMFAGSARLIAYSAVLREYATEALINISILLLLTNLALKKNIRLAGLIILGLTGAVVVWVSNSAMFTLGVAAVAIPTYFAVKGQRANLFKFAGVAVVWAASMAANYALVIKPAAADSQFLVDLAVDFPPTGGNVWSNLNWFKDRFLSEVLYFQIGSTYLPALVLAIGGYRFWVTRRLTLILLVAPLPVVWLLSTVNRFPITGRHLLFMAPAVMLLIAQGVGTTWAWARGNIYKTVAAGVVAIWLVVGLVGYYFRFNIYFGEEQENIKQILKFLQVQRRQGDWLYVYNNTIAPYKYYAPRYGMADLPYVEGSYRTNVTFARYTQDVQSLSGKGRVWAIFTHNYDWGLIDEQAYIVSSLEAMGKRLNYYPYGTSALYLYDLSR